MGLGMLHLGHVQPKETIMEHYIVVHTVSDEPSVETFQRLFNTAEDAKKFAIRVADSYKVESPDARITDNEDTVRVTNCKQNFSQNPPKFN